MIRVEILSLVAICFCFQLYFTMSSESSGFSLKLFSRDSPESPLYPGNLSYVERMERLIRFSKERGDYLENTLRPNDTTDPADDLHLPTVRQSFYYLVSIAIGLEIRKNLFLAVDTASALLWTQCEPCINCFRQRDPIYDPRTSSSYQSLPCSHPFCSGNNPIYRCVENLCLYRVMYGDGSYTRGVASLETFLFSASPNGRRPIHGVVFGCSLDSQRAIGTSAVEVTSGILGLNKRQDSIMSQLSNELNRRFSYCLAPFTQLQQRTGALRFGDNILPPPQNVQTIRFAVPRSNKYYLNLLDISVGDVRLGFHPGQFEVRPDASGGLLIDSGTILSRIDQTTIGERNAYHEVMASFQAYYEARNLQREWNGPGNMDLCYKYPPDFNDFPTMTYHLDGADYPVEARNVHFPGDRRYGFFCVALMGGNGKSILGSWHQQNMRITYDGNINELQFAPENCDNDVL